MRKAPRRADLEAQGRALPAEKPEVPPPPPEEPLPAGEMDELLCGSSH